MLSILCDNIGLPGVIVIFRGLLSSTTHCMYELYNLVSRHYHIYISILIYLFTLSFYCI